VTDPWNVLFITADQWRGDCLSALGHPCLETPNLDRLAAEGTLFARHYGQATPCGPGRASLYTGLYLHNHRSVVNGAPLDARHSNVALESRKAGYEPVLFGYTDVSADPRAHHPRDPSLTSYEGLLPGMTPVVWLKDDQLGWLADLRAKGYEIPPGHHGVFRPKADLPGAAGRGPTFAPALYRAEDSNTAFLTDEAMKYISVRRDQPWFVHLSYLAPHPPFVVPEPYHDLYDPGDVPLPVRAESPEAEAAQHPWLAHYLRRQRDSRPSIGVPLSEAIGFDERALRQLRATYYAMMSEVDAQIGRLIDLLAAEGLYERTLIVFTSDHGEQLGDHWLLGKRSYFDQSFHIPLILRDPRPEADRSRGRRVAAFSENVDVMPSIVEWLGLEPPAQCDGLSLLPFCLGEDPDYWRQEAHWEYDFRDIVDPKGGDGLDLAPDQCAMNVIRGQRYKYVHFTALPPLFFDLEQDPGELHDLAGDPASRDLVLAHAQKLLSWRMNHDERTLANQRLTPGGVVEHKGRRW
jgi:arylsulfatase A-like enzyme